MSARDVVLILQIGSLGDTVVSLPCYREIARRHPHADRYLVTNYPIGSKMVPAEAILLPTGVITSSIEYPMPLRQLGKVVELRRRIAALRPSVLYYLLPETRLDRLVRHYAFFRLCGIGTIRGLPWSRDLRFSRELAPGLWESEAARLLRTLGAPPGRPADSDRDLALTEAERARAAAVLAPLGGTAFVAISVGGKVPLNNWGDDNWGAVLRRLSSRRPALGVVFVGSADERPRNDGLAAQWDGQRDGHKHGKEGVQSLNTCGLLTPRETAAVLERAAVFAGHDTGTLHLAAAVDTPVVGVFSARNPAGVWFSDRPRDTFFYDRVPCAGCRLKEIDTCLNDWVCMAAHDPEKVVAAIERLAGPRATR